MAFKTTIRDADVLRALLDLWEITCVHPKAVSLAKFLRQYPALAGTACNLSRAIHDEHLVTIEGRDSTTTYLLRWNKNRCAAPTLLQARDVLERSRSTTRKYVRQANQRRRAAAGDPVLMSIELHRSDGKTVTELVPVCNEIAGVIVTGDEILVQPVFRDPFQADRLNDTLEGAFRRRLVEGSWINIEP